MTTRIMSDLHFNHGLLQALPGGLARPKNYERKIWNSLKQLSKADTLIVIGDICIGKDAEMHKRYIEPLVCKKLLVRGNHDQKSLNRYMSHGWDWACDIYFMVVKGEAVFLTHQPLLDLPTGWRNIHGHFHDRMIKPVSERHILYSPEKEDYKPRNIEDLLLPFYNGRCA